MIADLSRPGQTCLKHIPTASDVISRINRSSELYQSRSFLAASIVFCAFENDKNQIVLENLELASSISEFKSSILNFGLYSALRLDDGDKVISIFKQLKEADRSNISQIQEDIWWSIIRSTRNSSNPKLNRLYIHTELALTNYANLSLLGGISGRFDFLTTLIDNKGDEKSIGLLLNTITKPNDAAWLLVNKKYDNIRTMPEFSQIKDLSALAKKDEEFWKKSFEAFPNSMENGSAYSNALRNSGKFSEALEVLNAILLKAKNEPAYYTDIEDQKNWLLNEKARVLLGLNRPNEAFDALREAIGANEYGGANVSQVINLAAYQLEYGLYREAISTLETVGKDRSKYADSLIVGINLCANHKLAKPQENIEAGINAIRSLGDSGWENLLSTQVCLGQTENAADTLVKFLEIDDYTSNALLKISALQSPIPFETEYQKNARETYLKIFQMPRVKEAIEKNGRIIELPIDRRSLQ